MALKTSIESGDFKLTSRSQRTEVVPQGVGVADKTYRVTSATYKAYSIEIGVVNTYMTENPTLDLEIELIQNMPTGAHLNRRTETRDEVV
jgi:hypothetical protein